MSRDIAMLVSLIFVISQPISGHGADVESRQLRGDLIILQGLAGEAEYAAMFDEWSLRWLNAAERGEFRAVRIRPDATGSQSTLSQKERFLAALTASLTEANGPLWLVLIGHGTFDTRTAKLNLAGEDLSARELDDALAASDRLTIVINCASSSAPFLEQLSQANRIIVTSTRSGDQINFSRFGDYLSEAIGETAADLDKDQQVSLLEAFLTASRKTLEFYEADGRIPTENALLDDNGDAKGTRAAAFEGVRAVAEPESSDALLDGFRAHQQHLIANDLDRDLPLEVIAKRNELEEQIELLRLRKPDLDEDAYYSQLESLFLKIAELVLPSTGTSSANRSNQP